jgi:hypothetical protein
VETCLLDSVLVAPSESGLKRTLYAEVTDRGACKVEREAPVEDLLYEIVDLQPPP